MRPLFEIHRRRSSLSLIEAACWVCHRSEAGHLPRPFRPDLTRPVDTSAWFVMTGLVTVTHAEGCGPRNCRLCPTPVSGLQHDDAELASPAWMAGKSPAIHAVEGILGTFEWLIDSAIGRVVHAALPKRAA